MSKRLLFSDSAISACYRIGDQRRVSSMRGFIGLPLLFLLPGCVASVVGDVVTAPIKVVSKTADVMTTSQSEADEKRGRELRKQEERLGKLARKRDEAREDCADGDREACIQYEALDAEITAEKERDL
jgi:hypothetical protein